MRQCGDLAVSESPAEFLPVLPREYPVVYKKKSSKYGYVDATATLDIETTSTSDKDGFLYSIQLNIGGFNVVFRYVEDFLEAMELVCERFSVSTGQRLVLYVHNLGFEHTFLTQILDKEWGLQSTLLTKPHKPLYIMYKNGVELRDSLKLFQKSLQGATKGMKHAKALGDLDYRVYRTPDTPFTGTEFRYVVHDVQGLYEAIEALKAQHGDNAATIPYTNTSMVLREVNRHIAGDRECYKAMKRLTLSNTQLALAYHCMAGGDTHGTRWKAGRTIPNCNSHDEKSAHPSQMLLRKFPMGEPVDMYDVEEEDLQMLISEGYGWIAEVMVAAPTIKPECPDPTISVSKCLAIEGRGGVDNGRLLTADGVSCYMDSNDYQRFKEAYDYDGIMAVHLVAFELDYLPHAFRESILEKFRTKEEVGKAAGKDYDFAKICLNTIFGGCAQKQVRDEYSLEVGEELLVTPSKWEDRITGMTDAEVGKAQKGKLPFLWGLWTASLSRLTLWELLKAAGWENAIYWDTDSVKYEGETPEGIKAYNDAVIRLNEERGTVLTGKDGKPVYIGIAEDEYPDVTYGYQRFRFLHAKCYAAEAWHDGEYRLETTIAGVDKEKGVKALGTIENLKDGFKITDAGGLKLKYVPRPVHIRHDFNRPTMCASFIHMEDRDYEISSGIRTKLEIMEGEVIAG